MHFAMHLLFRCQLTYFDPNMPSSPKVSRSLRVNPPRKNGAQTDMTNHVISSEATSPYLSLRRSAATVAISDVNQQQSTLLRRPPASHGRKNHHAFCQAYGVCQRANMPISPKVSRQSLVSHTKQNRLKYCHKLT
jgi:hypothetical protein